MKKDEILLKRSNCFIILEKDSEAFLIRKDKDNDIFFSTSTENLEFVLKKCSKSNEEWQLYLIFERFMQSILNRCKLNKQDNFSTDFFNFDNNRITLHSDGVSDNVLTIEYTEDVVKVSIRKAKIATNVVGNVVKISTRDSKYQIFCKEFMEFYRNLDMLERSINKVLDSDDNSVKKNVKAKFLSLFGRYIQF